MKRIILVCAAGMSTSMMVTRMNEAAAKLGLKVIIKAIPEGILRDYENEMDILLLGPQVGFMLKRLKDTYEPKGISVFVIDSIDYGTMNGEKVLKKVLGI